MASAHRLRWVSAFAIAVGAAASVATAAPDPFEACTRKIVAQPHSREGYSCLIEAGGLSGRLADLPRRFEAMIDTHPGHIEARRALGLTLGRLGRQAEAAEQLVLAADDFEDNHEFAAECETRTAAARYLTDSGRFDDANAELDRGEAAARRVGEDRLQALIELQRGWTAVRRNDYVAAGLFMRRAESHAFPDGPLNVRGSVVDGLAAVAWMTGRFEKAIELYRQQLAWAEERGDADAKSHALGNLLGAYRRHLGEGLGNEDDLVALAHEALAAAKESNSFVPMTRAHLTLSLFGGPEAADHARSAVAAARASGSEQTIAGTLSEAGFRLIRADPGARDEGFALLDEALRIRRDSHDLDGIVRTWSLHRSAWAEVGDLERTLDATEQLFAALEQLRDLQHEGQIRARSFANHSDSFKNATGYLLKRLHERPMDSELADRVFRFLERTRSRVLLDYLDATGVTQDGTPSDVLQPAFPDLDAIRARLADDEALVVFQVSTSESGGSWALVIDAAGVRTHPLASVRELNGQISLLQGLIDRRDGSEVELATWLGRSVLAPILDALPSRVRRLQMVPDGILWQLPFDALRVEPDGAVVGMDYDFELSPSATLWHRWREHPAEQAERSVLALADPSFVSRGATADIQRSGGRAGVPLGNLPLSRREARRVVSKLGGAGVLLVADQASERRLKRAALGNYAILHLAAHAIVDDDNPERSAVLLAPGADDEDGLLRPREIVALDLRDKLVLLSTCRSASGTTLAGEGPMSLARAFLQGDARAVVGSLWPLRDDDALVVMDLLADELSRGEPLGQALANARRRAAASGLPAATWSGLVMLGDGNWTVPARPAHRLPIWSLVILAGVVLAALCWTLMRYRRNLLTG